MHRSTRRSPRLQGYDYTLAGAYFVTRCTHHRVLLFGSVRGGEVIQSTAGVIAEEELTRISNRWPYVDLDHFVVMPNHIHAIILLSPPDSPDVGTPFLASDACQVKQEQTPPGPPYGGPPSPITAMHYPQIGEGIK